MRGRRVESYQDALRMEIPGALQRTENTPRHGSAIDVPCRHCGMLEALHTEKLLPPEVIRKKLQQRGWSIGNGASKHVCPVHHDLKPEPETKEQPMPANDPAPTPALRAVPAPSHDARAAKREAMAMLEESFNVTTGQYSSGITDSTVAQMAGLSESAVAQLREEFFGPLQEPDGFAGIRDELAHLETKRAALADDFAARMRDMRQGVIALNGKLDAMAKRNGWKP